MSKAKNWLPALVALAATMPPDTSSGFGLKTHLWIADEVGSELPFIVGEEAEEAYAESILIAARARQGGPDHG